MTIPKAKYWLLAGLLLLAQACQTPSSQSSSGGASGPSGGVSGGGGVSIPMPSGGGLPSPGIPGPGMPSPGMPGPPGGQSGSKGMPGPSGGQSGSAGMPGSPGGQSGSGGAGNDSLENLDRSFDESLGEFDDMILNEGNDTAGGTDGPDVFDPVGERGGAGGPLFEEGPLSSEEMAAEQGSGGSGGGGGTSSNQGGDAGNASGGAANKPVPVADLPADIDDGRGDDIVARQIREAAMVEADPALRDKLWAEYRRYKNQVQ